MQQSDWRPGVYRLTFTDTGMVCEGYLKQVKDPLGRTSTMWVLDVGADSPTAMGKPRIYIETIFTTTSLTLEPFYGKTD